MISAKKIKDIVKKEKFKIGKKSIEKMTNITENKIKEMLNKAMRNARYFGRKTIKEEDILE